MEIHLMPLEMETRKKKKNLVMNDETIEILCFLSG